MYAVIYKKAAVKALGKLPEVLRLRIVRELSAIAANPGAYRGDWKPLSGSPYWRLRMGGYRAVCEIRDRELVLLVLEVGPRGDVYK